MTLTREALLHWMDGQRLASRRIAFENARRLRELTPEQASDEYDGLCALLVPGETSPTKSHLDALVRVRRALDRVYERSRQT